MYVHLFHNPPLPGLSASNAKKSSKSVSGQMDAIALRDETVELKKALNVTLKERDLAKAQQVKLEKEVGRKDKQIEDLLASGHISVSEVHVVFVCTVSRIYLRLQFVSLSV